MDEKAPITWLIAEINKITSSGASATASAIAGVVTPIFAIGLGFYMILVALNYLRGAESEPVMDFGMRMIKMAVVIGLGLNMANYTDTVIPIVTGLGSDLASAVSGGKVSSNSLDELALYYLKILEDGYEAADGVGETVLFAFKATLVIGGLTPFLVLATVLLVIADVGAVMVASVGPLFFGTLLFPATRQYFSAWLNTALSYALIPLLVAVVTVISVGLSKEMLVPGGSTLVDTTFKKVFLAALGNLALLFVLRQVNSMASSLSAGGINAGQPGSLADAARTAGKLGGLAAKLGFRTARGAYRLGAKGVAAASNRRNSVRKAG